MIQIRRYSLMADVFYFLGMILITVGFWKMSKPLGLVFGGLACLLTAIIASIAHTRSQKR